jgi:hypothetical protein
MTLYGFLAFAANSIFYSKSPEYWINGIARGAVKHGVRRERAIHN